MPEIKRTFSQAKMNRDIDDRLLPEGSYRYARNVNIGESEGGDVGAVENLKGNEVIAGQDAIQGTTIGSVRDPNNDRIYWFTKGDTSDAIYEYDGTNVNTILVDPTGRGVVKPTCTPIFRSSITDVGSDVNTRPALPSLPTPPTGGCGVPGLESSNTFTFPGGGADFRDDGFCVPAPAPDGPVAIITGEIAAQIGTDIVLTSASTPTGATLLWSTDDTTETITITGALRTDGEEVTVTLVATDGGVDSPPASFTVRFTAAAVVRFNFAATTAGTIANAVISGGQPTEEGVEGITEPISFTVMATPSDGYRWLTLATISPSGLPAGFTSTLTSGQVGSPNAAIFTVSGTWDPTIDINAVITFDGGVTEVIPMPPPIPDVPINIISFSSIGDTNRYSTSGFGGVNIAFIDVFPGAITLPDGAFFLNLEFTVTPGAGALPGDVMQTITDVTPIIPGLTDLSLIPIQWVIADAGNFTTWTINITGGTFTNVFGQDVGNIIATSTQRLTRRNV